MFVKDLILFSAVQGRLLDHGKPLAGAKIERTSLWNMEDYPRQEFTTTDKDGAFSFPEVRGMADFGFLAKLFHVPTVSQSLYLHREGKEYLLYANSRGNYEPNTETGYPEIALLCDMKNLRVDGEDLFAVPCEVRKKKV